MPKRTPAETSKALRRCAESIRNAATEAINAASAALGSECDGRFLATALQELSGGLERAAARVDQQQLGDIHPADAPPTGALGGPHKIKVKTADDVAAALRWLAWMHSRGETVAARRDAQIAMANEHAARDMQVEIDGTRLTFAEWREQLEAAVSRYAEQHPEQIFDGKTKTAKFPTGTIKCRDVADQVKVDPDAKPKEIADGLAAKHKLPQTVADLIAKAGLTDRLKVSFALDLAGYKRLFSAGKITARNLPKGLSVAKAHTETTIKPISATTRSETGAA